MKLPHLLPALFVIFLTSCGGANTVSPPTAAPRTPAVSPTATLPPTDAPTTPPVTPLPMDHLPPDAAAMVGRVQQDLAERLSAPPGATMTLLSAEAVTWPDASLGCPRPNTGYIQVETPGFLITLLANGGRYTYHTDLRDNYVLCMNGEPGNPGT